MTQKIGRLELFFDQKLRAFEKVVGLKSAMLFQLPIAQP